MWTQCGLDVDSLLNPFAPIVKQMWTRSPFSLYNIISNGAGSPHGPHRNIVLGPRGSKWGRFCAGCCCKCLPFSYPGPNIPEENYVGHWSVGHVIRLPGYCAGNKSICMRLMWSFGNAFGPMSAYSTHDHACFAPQLASSKALAGWFSNSVWPIWTICLQIKTGWPPFKNQFGPNRNFKQSVPSQQPALSKSILA